MWNLHLVVRHLLVAMVSITDLATAPPVGRVGQRVEMARVPPVELVAVLGVELVVTTPMITPTRCC